MRDLRDPQELGKAYLMARGLGAEIEVAIKAPALNYRANESCIEKYGSCNDVEPKWMAVQVR